MRCVAWNDGSTGASVRSLSHRAITNHFLSSCFVGVEQIRLELSETGERMGGRADRWTSTGCNGISSRLENN